MRLLTGLGAPGRPPRDAVVTVGVFDGVHAAHQRLVRAAVSRARRLGGTSVVITFDPDPQALLHPRQAQPALMPLDERLAALQRLGVDWTWIIPFTRRFARLSAERFIRRWLIGRLRARELIVGESFVFGHARGGDARMLQRVGASFGLQVLPVRHIERGGAAISSSRIRRLVQAGRPAAASALLGRPPALYGHVVRGTGRGRRLGFPTANVQLTPQVLPPQGVYAVTLRVRDRRWISALNRLKAGRATTVRARAPGLRAEIPGVMNLGTRPTFGPGPVVCEVHVLGYASTLRGRPVAVSLLGRLRGERCFPTWQALRRQIRRDVVQARRVIARCGASARRCA